MQLFKQYYHQKQTQKALDDPTKWKEVLYTPRQVYTAVVRRMSALVVLCAVAGFVGFSSGMALPKTAIASVAPPPAKVIERNAELDAFLVANAQYTIGVAIESVASGQQVLYGKTDAFPAASTSKVITAAAYYKGVENGELSLEKKVGSYPASFQIQQMVQQSNNIAWNLLVNEIGRPVLQAYATGVGIDYVTGENTVSPKDMATFLSKLYAGKLLNADHTKQLLSFMQQTNEERMIPSAVPADITVYHKYGLLNGALHDVSIMTKGDESYTLTVYTLDTTDASDLARIEMMRGIVTLVVAQLFSE